MRRRRGWIALALGLLLGIVGAVLLVSRFASTFGAEEITTPASIERELDAGTWVVFERTGTTTQTGVFTSTSRRSPQVTDIMFVDANGATVEPAAMTGLRQTLDINGREYVGIAEVELPERATWTITIDSENASEVVIVPSLTANLGQTAAGAGLVGLGGLMTILGIALIVIDRGRRSHDEARQTPPPSPMTPHAALPPPVPNRR